MLKGCELETLMDMWEKEIDGLHTGIEKNITEIDL